MRTVEQRLTDYIREYSETHWPGFDVPDPDDGDLVMTDVRADGYANAHVEGEHEASGLCPFTSARECGERTAAAEYVETH